MNEVRPDPRPPVFITHRQVDLLRQRSCGLALGYEDLNDHDTLRRDLAWQTALAYVVLETIRRVGLKGTALAHTQVATIRLKLLKIGTVIVRNIRRIRLLFSSAYPDQELFTGTCAAMGSS